MAIAILSVAWPLAAVAEQPELGSNLAQLIEYAREHNPEFAAIRHEAEAIRQRATSAATLADPVLRVELMDVTNEGAGQGTGHSTSLLPSRVGSTQYTLMQSVPWFGQRGLQRGVAEAQRVQAEGQIAATWAELTGKIKTVYAQYYYLAASEQLIRETLDLIGNLEQVAQMRYANGLGAQQDVIRMQIEQTGLQTELLDVQTEQHHMRAQLNSLLSRPALAALAAPVQSRPLPAESQLDYALLEQRLRARNPQLMIAEARTDEAEKSRDIAFNKRYPNFTFGIAPTQTGSRISEWGLMLEMNIPLQQGLRRSGQREAEAMLAASGARKEALLNQMLANLAEHVVSLKTARRNESLIATQLLPQAELSYQSAMAGYQSGKVDFATLLDAQRQILKTRQQRLKTQYQAQVLLAELEQLTGEEL